mgnify:CR=1 FL=1
MSVIVEGKTFKSNRQAALAYGVNYSTFKRRLENNWTMEEALNIVTRVSKRKGNRPITVEGKDYPSISHAAKHYQLPSNLCRDRIDLGWPIEEVFGLIKNTERKPYKKEIVIEGVKFPSLRKAARSVNEHFTNFLRYTSDGVYTWPEDRWIRKAVVGTLKPFYFESHIYPTLYMMLMSCPDVESNTAIQKNRNFSKHRNRNKEINSDMDIRKLSSLSDIDEPTFFYEYDTFINNVDKKLDLDGLLYDATEYLTDILIDFGFSREGYLDKYYMQLHEHG